MATPRQRSFRDQVDSLLQEFGGRRPIRAGSLLVSVFGDAVAPRGGSVWLGSLIPVLGAFGVGERLVRTSVFRLVRQGWLSANKSGRRSYYSLTDKGLRRFQEASRRIYSEPRQDWAGDWFLVLLTGVDAAEREELRRELRWLGFAPFTSTVLAHPAPSIDDVRDCLAETAGGDSVVTMTASVHDGRDAALQDRVQDAWQLDELGARYEAFVDRFQPLYTALRNPPAPDPEAAFCLRVLVIHEYRRILLRDPLLPAALLPRRWQGAASFQLCRNLYAKLAMPAESYLSSAFENEYGPLPPAEPAFFTRFGGQFDSAPAAKQAVGAGRG